MRSLLLLAVLSLLASCRGGGSFEKGGPVAVSVKQEALAQAYAPRRLALVVGIAEFQDPAWRSLRYARKDAEDLAAALRDPARGGFHEVTVVTAPSGTTRAAVLDAMAELASRARRPEDIAVVYFSAHGTLARDAKGELRRYLVTSDASFRKVHETALPVDELKARFDALGSRRRVLMLATCHSGSGKSLLPPEVAQELEGIKSGFYARPLEESSRAAVVLSASDWGETAREDESLQNDIYTHFLIDGLSGAADRNVDGAVTATEAHDHARRRTYAFTGGRQRPSAEILEVGADPIVLSGSVSQTGQPELYSYNPRLDGFTLKVDGDERGELPGGAAVKAGRHKIELTKGGATLLSTELDLRPGDRTELDALISAQLPRRSVSLVGGGAGFLDARTRREVVSPFPTFGLLARYDDLLAPRISLVVDAAMARGRSNLVLAGLPGPLAFTYTSVVFGASAAYTVRLGSLTLYGGPRVAGLWLARSFEAEMAPDGQSYFTMSPGAWGGASYALTDHLELNLQAGVVFTYVTVDGVGGWLGFAGGSAGAGYRF